MWEDRKEELYNLLVVEKRAYEEVGRMYKVSGSYIRKLSKLFGFPLGYRRKINPKETLNKGGYKK